MQYEAVTKCSNSVRTERKDDDLGGYKVKKRNKAVKKLRTSIYTRLALCIAKYCMTQG